MRGAAFFDLDRTLLRRFEAVRNPGAVNPDRPLLRIAAARGWSVLRFRTAHAA